VLVTERRLPIELIHCSPTRQTRFWAKVRKEPDCWIWTGANTGHATHPYGRFRIGYGQFVAHRVAWVLDHGEDLPPEMEIDHLCRRTLCVRPSHLDAVTHGENLRRGRRWTGDQS